VNGLWATKSEVVGLIDSNCPCNEFPRFPTDVILIHQRHRCTDGQSDRQMDSQTDGRRAISIPRFLQFKNQNVEFKKKQKFRFAKTKSFLGKSALA